MATDNPDPINTSWSSKGTLQDLHESHTKLSALHHDATARLNKLERRVNKLDSDDSDSDASSEASDLDDDYRLGFEENIIHEVRDVDFEHFKNRYTEKDGKYCIEVLVSGSDLYEQIRRELKRRDVLDSHDMKPGDTYDESDEKIIQRVRIQSPSVLFLLHSVLETEGSNGSFLWKGQNRLTFFRPFMWFIHAQERMRLKLEELQQKFSLRTSSHGIESSQTVAELVASLEQAVISEKPAARDGAAQSSEATPAVYEQQASEAGFKSLPKRVDRDVLEQALLKSYQTLLALRCYIDFVDNRIAAQAANYRESIPKTPLVRFQDLSYLFRVGELVYVSSSLLTPKIANGPPNIGRIRLLRKPDATATPSWQDDLIAVSAPLI
jgi:hypothetical protein